jgi:hypothetical protein
MVPKIRDAAERAGAVVLDGGADGCGGGLVAGAEEVGGGPDATGGVVSAAGGVVGAVVALEVQAARVRVAIATASRRI